MFTVPEIPSHGTRTHQCRLQGNTAAATFRYAEKFHYKVALCSFIDEVSGRARSQTKYEGKQMETASNIHAYSISHK